MQLYMFDHVLKVIAHAAQKGCDFSKASAKSKNTFFNQLKRDYPVPAPNEHAMNLETNNPDSLIPTRKGRDSAKTIYYNAKEQILDLLSDDALFGNIDNLVVNKDNPFGKYEPTPGLHEEVYDGEVYQNLWKDRPYVEGVDLVIMLILYTDEIGVTWNQRRSMQPVLMAFAILNRSQRYLTKNVRLLGHIPSYSTKSSAQKATIRGSVKGQGRSCRMYHRMNSALMREVATAQEELSQEWTWIRMGNQIKQMRVHCPVVFQIGDAKSQDMLACRYNSHRNSKRISRFCKTPFERADDTQAGQCQAITILEVKSLNEEALLEITPGATKENVKSIKKQRKVARGKLKEICSHVSSNSLWGLDLCGQPGLPLPHDGMHLLMGVIQYLLVLVYSPLTDKEKAAIDDLVEEIFVETRTGERSRFPRTNFSRGMTNLTMLTADEWVGMVLVTVILAKTEKGKKAMEQAFTRQSARENLEKTRIVQEKEVICASSYEGLAVHEMILVEEDVSDEDDEDRQELEGVGIEEETTEGRRSGGPKTRKKKPKKKKGASRRLGDDEELPPTNQIEVEDFVDCLEDILTFHAWYKEGYPKNWKGADIPTQGSQFYWDQTSEERLHKRICFMLESIKRLFPRKKGNKWKLQKIHELMHIAGDVAKYGLPANFDAGWGERELKSFGKDPSKTAQMHAEEDFLWQVNKRLYEGAVLTKMLARMGVSYGKEAFAIPVKGMLNEDSESEGEEEESSQWRNEVDVQGRLRQRRPQWQVTCCGGHCFDPRWVTKKNRIGKSFVPEEVCKCLAKEYSVGRGNGERVFVDGFTEFYKNGMLFRSHPDYRSRGPWYEWAMIEFENLPEDKNVDDLCGGMLPEGRFPFGCFPSKILAIFKCPRDETVKLVVHPCTYSTHEEDSRLVECWELDYQTKRVVVPNLTVEGNILDEVRELRVEVPNLTIVEASSVRERIYVVEEMPGFKGYIRRDVNPEQSKRVVYVRDRKEYWPHHFKF
jgi:hypothetical protein